MAPPAAIPDLQLDSYARELPPIDEAPHRLRTLSIKDFRGIREMNIDLAADLVVVHGRNGTGKTSLFDALEWALLGEVEYLESTGPSRKDPAPFVNLFSSDGVAGVKLQLQTSDGPATLERIATLEQKGTLRYEERSFSDDRSALIEILGEQARNLNVGSLRDMVRSVNFLTQSTIWRFLSKQPGEQYAALSRLLGTYDYARFLMKLTGVRSEFAKEEQRYAREIEVRSDALRSKQSELEQVEARLVDSPEGSELEARLEETLRVVHTILTELNSEVSSISIDEPFLFEEVQTFLNVASEWRSTNTSAVEKHLQDVEFFEKSGVLIEGQESEVRSIRAELSKLDSRNETLQSELQSQEKERREVENTIGATSDQVKVASIKAASLHQLTMLLEREEHLRRSAEGCQQKVDQLGDLQNSLEQAREVAQQRTSLIAGKSRQISAELSSLQQQLQSLAVVKNRIAEVPRYREELARVQKDIQEYELLTTSKQSELDSTGRTYDETFSAIQSSIKTLDGIRSTMEQYRALLSSFRAHIHGHDCPLCGHHYDSTEELMARIEKGLESDPPELIRIETELQTQRQKLRIIDSTRDMLRSDIARAAAVIRSGRNRTNELTREFAELENLAAGVEIDIGLNDVQAMDDRIKLLESRYADLSRELANLELENALRVGEYSRVESELGYTVAGRQAAAGALDRELGELSNVFASKTVLAKSLSLTDLNDLPKRKIDIEQQLSSATQGLAKFEQTRTGTDARIRSIQAEMSSVLTEKSSKENRLAALTFGIEELKARRTQIEKYDSASLNRERDQGLAMLARMRELEAEIGRARKQASWLLARRDATALSNEIATLTQESAELTKSRDQNGSWALHLEQLGGAITKARHEAENWQLANYGPFVGSLYRRFSAHPVFSSIRVAVDTEAEEIRMSAEVNEFAAQYVKRPQKELPPRQYFNEAQANVLALSIFLSNAFQQSWSRLNSVFMDDPVQNMDDLNSNAFIDTLRALAISSGRQFVVATCDQRLYKLMLVKLACLNANGKTRFSAYRLEGISVEGPHLIKDI
jgi:DNA repair exonuclease SbcCD ATPase subunit